MTTSLHARVRRLENTSGSGGGCDRCSGTTMIVANGEVESVTKDARKLPPEEAEDFALEEEEHGGRCPVCGGEREEVTVGSWS
jgi:Zn finger protein HypA/HybF involved in hydrogenase expression